MRIALLSDIHGDHLAFVRVLADLAQAGPVDEVVLGGDLAQGGPQPAEVIDEIRRRGWRSVLGNADELLIRIGDGMSSEDAPRFGEAHGPVSESTARLAEWSVSQLGQERLDFLRSLPLALEWGPFAAGKVTLVHATPWSTEDVILPDSEEALARRALETAATRLVAYGHIHTPYQRKVGDGVLISVGAVSGSNDADPRPAYTIVTVAETIAVEVRRVDWPTAERLAAYESAGIERRFAHENPGPLPVRSQPGPAVTVWP